MSKIGAASCLIAALALILSSSLLQDYGALAEESPFKGIDADSHLMPDEPLTRFSFGSCSKHYLPQPMWRYLVDKKRQVFTWLGDIIYADKRTSYYWMPDERIIAPYSDIRQMYSTQKQNKGYRELAESGAIIVGVWDDHDYGTNNGDSTYKDKIPSKDLLMEFLEEPPTSPRLHREGVYASYTFGPEGKRVKLILLDGRYFMSKHPGPDSDMLGEQQWAWLEHELRNSDAQVNLIGSGVQVISDDKDTLVTAESWGRHHSSRKRLLELIASTEVNGVIFLSGDIHMAEICALKCSPVPYTLYDITSSGMTHSWQRLLGPLGFLMPLGFFIVPTEFRVDGPYDDLNVGTIDFDWEESLITIEIVDEHGQTVIRRVLSLDDLKPDSTSSNSCTEEEIHFATIASYLRHTHWTWKIRLGLIAVLLLCVILTPFVIVGLTIRKLCNREKKPKRS